MKTELRVKISLSFALIVLILISSYSMYKISIKEDQKSSIVLKNNIDANKNEVINTIENEVVNNGIGNVTNVTKNDGNVNKTKNLIVYDGLTKDELVSKVNKNLSSTLEGTGELFVDLALKYSIDPYLAVAIVLHETGCSSECSDLVKYCYNVGGQKGYPSCGNGSYASFSNLEEGITGFMENLYNRYYSKGLTTPELINPKYAQSTAWAGKINYYIQKIKAS